MAIERGQLIQLPKVSHEAINRSMRRYCTMDLPATYDNSGVYANPLGVSISTSSVVELIKQPRHIIEYLTAAVKIADALRDNDAAFLHRRGIGYPIRNYLIRTGMRLPTSTFPWKLVENTEDDYLTLTENNFEPGLIPIACTHYMTVSRHEELMRDSMLKLKNLVAIEVQSGVSAGVAKAIEESTATLSQVEKEKQSISQQIAALQKEKQRLEQIETRLQERDRIDAERQAAKEASRGQRSTAGYVYLLKETNGIHYKIGRTNNPENRVKEFGVKLPFKVEYTHLIQTDDMYALEAELHIRYASKRVDGEWFLLSEDDVLEIVSM